MNTELIAFAAGTGGLAAGYGLARIREIEERCDVLKMAKSDVLDAIGVVDRVLSSDDAPFEAKGLVLHLLTALGDEGVGKPLALNVFSNAKPSVSEGGAGKEMIETALRDWAARDPNLEREANRAFRILTMALAIAYLNDKVELRRVERKAALDPDEFVSRMLWGPRSDRAIAAR